MQLDEALIEESGDGFIVPGRITISPQSSGNEIPPHDHLLINFARRFQEVFTFRAVASFEMLESGLCRVTEASARCIWLFCWTKEFPLGNSERRIVFEGVNGGTSLKIPGKTYAPSDGVVTTVKSDETLTEKGLQFRFEIVVVPVPGKAGGALPERTLTVEGCIPWATLILRRFAVGGRSHQFRPRGPRLPASRVVVSPRNPGKLADLLLAPSPGAIFLTGRLQLERHNSAASLQQIPWIARSIRQTVQHIRPASQYEADELRLGWSDWDINLSDCGRIERSQNGFCSQNSGAASLNLSTLNAPLIEKLLKDRTVSFLNLEGDELGWSSWHVGLGSEPSEGRDVVRQDITGSRSVPKF